LQLVDSRFFVDFAVDFSSDFSGEMEEFVQNGLKIFKNFRRSQQSTTWPIRDPATVYFFRESWPTVDFSNKNPATVDLSSKVDCRLQCLSLVDPCLRRSHTRLSVQAVDYRKFPYISYVTYNKYNDYASAYFCSKGGSSSKATHSLPSSRLDSSSSGLHYFPLLPKSASFREHSASFREHSASFREHSAHPLLSASILLCHLANSERCVSVI
jgi:hypothetical protein